MTATPKDEVARIKKLHEQLRADFLRRDAARFPGGWKLPPNDECGEAWFRRHNNTGGAA